LRQILVNLISNAVKFTLEGSVTVSVSGEPAEDGRYHLHFQVRDTGIGISDNVRDRLFKPFSQGDTSTNRRFGGTGLGLAISKRLCELMGGRIWVESNCSVPGGGSTFHFTITTFASDLPPAWLPTNGSEEDDGGNCLVSKNIVLDYPPENLKILLAEDNLVNQKVALKMLSKLGYRVDVASNGLEVLAALHRIPYDVILMDCQMPEMDGYDATLQIRASELASKRPPVRIIAMTAYAMKGDEEECLASGMDDYLSKPVREAELRRALQKCRPAASLVTVEPAAIPDVSPPEEIVEELLDTVTLQELADVDVTDIVELVDLFRTQTKELMTALNWAVASAESQEINRIAHKLAGSSAACGLKAVITPLRELEKKGKEGDLRRTGDLLDRIDQLLKSSDLALDRYIDDLRKC
jgi:CheY-like chemotaxis protein/HPt (histidine-containing phosphotransfer) domain-containing protein